MKTSESAKEIKIHRDMLGWKSQNNTAGIAGNKTSLHKSNDIGERRNV